jgi:hypothetical protein
MALKVLGVLRQLNTLYRGQEVLQNKLRNMDIYEGLVKFEINLVERN